MSGPGSCVRLSWRAWLLVAPAAVLLIGLAAWLPLARPASAQTQLTLADFDDAGVDVEFAALLEVAQDTSGGWTLLYQGPPRTPAAGTLVDGDRNVGTDDVAITRVRQNDTDGDLQLADSDTTFHIGDYFATGAGSDLDLYLQDDTTALAEVAFTLDGASNGSIRLGLPADAQTLLQGLSDGDRLIVAFARPAPDPPAQVMGVAATADDYDSITVSWTAVTDADGYVVEWDDDSAFASSAEATVSSGSTVTYQITGLTENTTHYVRVYATRTDTADGAVSDVASATTELQPPAQVTGLTATAASSTSIDVAWDAASLADGYTVEWGTTSGSYTDDDTTASTSHAITGLSASTTHYLRVTATRTGADDGTPSAERSAATEPGTLPPPAQVTGVSASADDHDSITVSWNAVTSTCGSNSPYYEVRWDDDSGFASPQDEEFIPDTTDRYQITGLQEGTPYFVQVRGVCTDLFGFYTAEGAWSAADSATTELQPPERVTGVIADATSDVEIMVSWVMAIRAGGYVVQWREDGQAFDASRQAAVTALMYDVTGLTADTRYYFQVIATRTGATDAAPSAEADATTEAAPTPGQVAGVAVAALSDRELQATWTAAANATGYVVQWDTVDTFADPDEARTSGAGVVIERLRAETEYHVRVRGTRAGATAGAYSTSASATTGDAQTRVWAERFPGGAIAAQLVLSAFGGVMAGVRFKSMKSPRREAVITGAMSLGALILPAFGLANEFWVIGVALLVLLASIAAIFLARR